MTTLRRFLAVSAAAVLAASLAACGGQGGDDDTGTTAEISTSAGAGDPAEPEEAIAEISNQVCEAGESGSYSLAATITNWGDTTMVYTVMGAVALVTGGTMQGSVEVKETVAAGESTDIAVENFYTYEGTDQVQCVVSATKVPEA